MKRKTKLHEGLADLAGAVEQDHEVQLARAELYKIAKYAIKLHNKLKHVSEEEGLDGWMQSYITRASEAISDVYHRLDYEELDNQENINISDLPSLESSKLETKDYMAYLHNRLDEKIKKSDSASDVIKDFQKSKNPKFKGKTKEERKKMALGAYYGMKRKK